ncbi:MAG: hypothetical protein HC849_16975 [Oscillatoriales cyanobacterium RU_3_3]|nr:hypothetical protein [Oscillatoriales cyanobacterium RU_3_3]
MTEDNSAGDGEVRCVRSRSHPLVDFDRKTTRNLSHTLTDFNHPNLFSDASYLGLLSSTKSHASSDFKI